MPNISRSKGNQRMTLGQLIEYNMRNIFPERSCKQRCGESILRLFPKNQNWAYLWINSLKYYTVLQYYKVLYLVIVYQIVGYRKILKVPWRSLVFTSEKTFLKNKKEVWNYSPCLIFCIFFKEKYFPCYILLTDQIPLIGCLYFMRYWAICVL